MRPAHLGFPDARPPHAWRGACAAAVLAWLPLATTAAAAAAGDKDPASFSHKDWELACDNTRTCRAAGYQSEDGGSEPVSLRLTRAAGAGAPVQVDLQLGGEEITVGPLRLKVGAADIRGLRPRADIARLPPDAVRSVLPELLRNDRAVVTTADGGRRTVSLAGASAVLLKMDEAQGRLDTPGALVRRGTRPESSVPAPLPPPVVKAVLPAAARAGDAALAARIFPSLDLKEAKEQCTQAGRVDPKALTIDRLTAHSVLVSLGCGMGAYNFASLLWIADDTPPYAPRAIEPNGEFDAKDGSVTLFWKGRGVADCVSSETWHFDGKDFVRSGRVGDGLCRGFAGGAWKLPRYVTRLEGPAAAR